MLLEMSPGAMENLPWFVWEEVISFLGTRERWRLLTLDRIWRDKIVADSLQVVCFKSDPLACQPQEYLKRSQAKVKSINMFSSKNVDPKYFMRSYPKLKHLLLNNFCHEKALVQTIFQGEFSECFKRLTCLEILDTLELVVLQKILAQTVSLEVLRTNLKHLSTHEIITGISIYCTWPNLRKFSAEIDSLDLKFLSVVSERFKKLQRLGINFVSCAPDLTIYCTHLPRNLATLSFKSRRSSITLDLNITEKLASLELGLNCHLLDPQNTPCNQALNSLRLQNISITTATELVDHFSNVTKLCLKYSKNSQGIAQKLVYGLEKLRSLVLQNILEEDSLFEGSTLEISSLNLQMPIIMSSTPIFFIFTGFPRLIRLTVDFYITHSISIMIDHTKLPELCHLHFLSILKHQPYSAYDLLLELSPNLISLYMPKQDYEKYLSSLQISHPHVNLIPSH